MKNLTIVLLAALMFTGTATARDACRAPNENKPITYECHDELFGTPTDGVDGVDGLNGVDGKDGVDGVDGANGTNGTNGTDGSPGATGATGSDGINGVDGTNGTDGVDGVDGKDGTNGLDGRDGVVSTAWINETRAWQSQWVSIAAASDAIQIHLPQDIGASRVTVGMSHIYGTSGYALGYAYKNKSSFAFTLGIGRSGSQKVYKGSIGFEFD